MSPILSAIIGEKDCTWDAEFRASSIEGRRKVLTMISVWDADDSHQLIIEGLPMAEKMTTSDRREKHKTFPSERFGMLTIIKY